MKRRNEKLHRLQQKYLAAFLALAVLVATGFAPMTVYAEDLEPTGQVEVNVGDDDTIIPGDDDTIIPGDDDTIIPGDDDTIIPGDDDTVTPTPTPTPVPTPAPAPAPAAPSMVDTNPGELAKATNEISTTHGSMEITVPDTVGSTYTVTVYNLRYSQWGNVTNGTDETGTFTIRDKDGVETTQQFTYSKAWSEIFPNGEYYEEITNVPAGATVIVDDVRVVNDNGDWTAYTSAKVGAIITSSDSQEEVTVDPADPVTLEPGTTQYFTGQSTTIELDDYLDVGGQYDLAYFLNHFNVVSLNDIQAIHIVGPILAVNSAYYVGESGSISEDTPPTSGVLYVSDYSRGHFSYVGTPVANTAGGTALAMNYGYDSDYETLTGTTFTRPVFYIKNSTHNGIVVEAGKQYIVLKDGTKILSPNDGGATLTYQNDDFIDLDALRDSMVQGSQDLLKNGQLEGPSHMIHIEEGRENPYYTLEESQAQWARADWGTEGQTNYRLKIQAGYNYVIPEGLNITEVDVDVPDGYDFFNHPWLSPTTINYAGGIVNPVNWGGKTYSLLPMTFIDGEELDTGMGLNLEYGEGGCKIIYNLPNVVTTEDGNNRLSFIRNGNFAGHLVAPQAEIWNYRYEAETFTWGGGNINGTVVAADFHVGTLEMHMWPYGGKTESGVFAHIEANKNLENGDISQYSYDFTLSKIEGETYTGLANAETFPITATSEATGLVSFPSLVFTAPGTFKFHVAETIPQTPDETVDYDRTIYEVTIEVTKDVDSHGNTDFSVQNTYHKIQDRDGIPCATPVEALEIIFTNIMEKADEPTGFTFYKQSENSLPLAGATFTVEQITSLDDETPVADGFTETVTSQSDGTVLVANIPADAVFKLTETSAPNGYLLPDDHWFITSDGEGNCQILASDKTPVESNTIINFTEGFHLPNTGGAGTLAYYFFGLTSMVGALTLALQKKRKYNT